MSIVQDGKQKPLSQLAHSPYPAYALSSLFFASSIMVPLVTAPPVVVRVGFSAIFAGSGYITSTGDYRNGNGTTTAWNLTYLFLYARRSFRRPINLWTLGLTLSTATSAAIYGGNYFYNQDFGKEPGSEE